MGKSEKHDPTGIGERIYSVHNLDSGVSVAKHVRLAATSSQRRRGLLGIVEMDRHSGLWIYPCEAIHTFGMKMRIDVIFLDAEHRVRKICREVVPNRISFCLSASSVIELAAGVVSSSGTQVNHRLQILAE